jgi:hypothetical protein
MADVFTTMNASAGATNVLDAVNEVLESVGELPITTVPSTSVGASIHNRALLFLERANMRVQAMGWPENTTYAYSVTAALLSDNALAVSGAGSDGHRTVALRRLAGAVSIWDADVGATDDTAIQMDIIEKIDFSACGPELRANIIATASHLFQRRIQGSPQADQALTQERQIADMATQRNSPIKRNVPLGNLQSMLGGQQQQQQQPPQG